MHTDNHTRCGWAQSHELLRDYHDSQWGVPVHDDQLLFEMLNLEGAQAGLSWLTILARREGYLRAFDNFDAKIIAEYGDAKRAELMQDAGIVRNRLKTDAVISNAKAYLVIVAKYGSFHGYIWDFIEDRTLLPVDREYAEAASVRMSKDLKRHGFKFVGPTICYAFMQSVGMINDHEPGCYLNTDAIGSADS